ncbi:MAG: chemotaxis-specific protein-glutamate methyltransferase CheB [Planctomycetaceae bacterium]
MNAKQPQSDKIRVMIVEDSRVIREFLEHIIRNDPQLEVVASVDCAEKALQVLDRVMPHVISMDIRLPGMNGFEATKRIMEHRPTPIVVVSASVESEDLAISMNALRAGALAVIEKPVGTSHKEYEVLSRRLCTQLAIMSQVKVIRQRFNRPKCAGREWPAPERFLSKKTPCQAGRRFRMVGVVASTGGPNALQQLLSQLPADFPLPIVLVQHITASFHDGFVTWLRDMSPLPVLAGSDGQVPRPGHVYVAPADRHLRVGAKTLQVVDGEPVCANRPSGTFLFRSMAESLGDEALGVLLTGMGADGALGLHDIRFAGGLTIAEDESTAVVYGMPKAAVELNAVCELLSLPEIAPRLCEIAACSDVTGKSSLLTGSPCR